MNASTFTARVVASTGADVAAALSAAVGALSGPSTLGHRAAC
jgi:citrate synthase